MVFNVTVAIRTKNLFDLCNGTTYFPCNRKWRISMIGDWLLPVLIVAAFIHQDALHQQPLVPGNGAWAFCLAGMN